MKLDRRLMMNLAAVLALLVLTVGWVITNLVGGVVDRPFAVVADFASTGGVFTNQEVTYRGVLVGKVGRLALNDDGVDVELLIEPGWNQRIPADVVASVHSKSAVGEQFVNLTPGTGTTETLGEDDAIPRERTELPVDFQALLESLDRVLSDVPPERTGRLVTTLADGLGGRGEQIATILRSLGTLSEALASVAPEQRRLLANAPSVGRAFLDTKDEFAAAIDAADEVLAGIGDEPDELRRLLTTNDRLAREGLALLTRRGVALRKGIAALADFVEFQLSERTEIEKSLTYLPQFLHAIEDASIRWRSPEGRTFYRIRVGLVFDNVPSTWPCKYRLPFEYERHYFVRKTRTPVTTAACKPSQVQEEQAALTESLLQALEEWSEDPEQPRVDGRTEGSVAAPEEASPESSPGFRERSNIWGHWMDPLAHLP